MFETIGLRRAMDYTTSVQGLDAGAVAEALLFYGQVNLLLDPGSLNDALQLMGPEGLLRLARNDYATVYYSHQVLGFPPAGNSYWTISTLTVQGWEAERLVQKSLEEMTGRRGYSKRLAERLLSALRMLNLDDTEIVTRATEDVLSPERVAAWLPLLLSSIAPSYRAPAGAFLRVLRDSTALMVETNLDFAAITAAYRELTDRSDNSIEAAHLLLAMAAVQEDIALAERLGSDLSLTPMRSDLLRLYDEELLTVGHEAGGPAQLQDFVFDDARAIRHAVNSGRVSFDDVLDLVDRSRQFHTWLLEQPPDADLLKQYFREATRGTWVDRLPAGLARWLLVTGGGAAASALVAGPPGIAIAAGLSAVDASASLSRGRHRPGHFLGTTVRKALHL